MRQLIKPFRRLKREIMQLIDKDYIKKKLSKRKGYCKKCGGCCRGCRHLGKDDLCKVYNKRSWLCYKNFPLDKKDQKLWKVENCRYIFVD